MKKLAMEPGSLEKPYARYWPKDHQGYLINDTSKGLMPKIAHEVYQELDHFLKGQYGEKILSIYLRGSAAWGAFIPGLSDLDFFAITSIPNLRWKTQDAVKIKLQELEKRFQVKIECPFTSVPTKDTVLESWPHLSPQIKCFSVLLSGRDWALELPPFKVGKSLMPHGRWFVEDIAEFLAEKQSATEIQNIAKFSLRCAFELVMEREGVYTASLELCGASFIKYYPEYERVINGFLSVFLEPAVFPEYQEEIYSFWEKIKTEFTE